MIRSFLVLILIGGCSYDSDSGAAVKEGESPSQEFMASALGSCIGERVIIYSDFRVDTAVTGDISGLRYYLHPSAGSWSGEYQEAAGEWGGVHSGVLARIDPATDSIVLTAPTSPGSADTVWLRG